MYTYIHTYVHTHIHTYIHTYTHTHIHIFQVSKEACGQYRPAGAHEGNYTTIAHLESLGLEVKMRQDWSAVHGEKTKKHEGNATGEDEWSFVPEVLNLTSMMREIDRYARARAQHFYIFSHVYTYINICAQYIYAHIYIYTHTHIHIFVRDRQLLVRSGEAYVYIYAHIYVYIHTCMHTYIHTYIHTYMHAYMHTYTYIQLTEPLYN